MKCSLALFLSSLFLLIIGCERSTAPISSSPVSLTLENVGVTDAELHLKVDFYQPKDSYQLLRDGQTTLSGLLSTNDTTLIDTTLRPAHSYTYRAILIRDATHSRPSANLIVTTNDTTSHNFQWQIFNFESLYGNSSLHDVEIVEDNNIWAVGEIYADSSQPSLPYNAVHWDGMNWELQRIYVNYQGQPNLANLEGVFALPDGKLIFSSGLPYLPEESGWRLHHLWDMGILGPNDGPVTSIWGTSLNNIFLVGSKGTIVHYGGNTWQKQYSGTDLTLTDIYSYGNGKLYSVGINYNQGLGVVLELDGNQWKTLIKGCVPGSGFIPNQLFKTQLYGTAEGIWEDEKGTIYTVGNLMYRFKNGIWDYVKSLPENYIDGNQGNWYRGYLHAVRGNASNDIFIFGESETIIHFNGISWKKIGPAYQPWSYNFWYSCDVKGDLIVGVGKTIGAAKIVMIRR